MNKKERERGIAAKEENEIYSGFKRRCSSKGCVFV